MTTSGFCNSAPEAPSAINITQTVIELDGGEAFHYIDLFTRGAGTITIDGSGLYTRMVLSYYPVSPNALTVYLNGVAQKRGVGQDYLLIGRTIVFASDIPSDYNVMAQYFTATEVTSDTTEIAVGTVVGFDYDGSTLNVPAGWLALDGATSYSKSTYASLWAFADANGYVLSSTATEFVLKLLTVPLYDGVTLVQTPGIIKY